jgi:hypothetical protein
MAPVRLSIRFTLGMALVIFVLAALWLTAVPNTLGPSTYVSIATLLAALAGITMKTYSSGRGEASLATLIHETDIAPRSVPATDIRIPAAGLER